MENINWTNIKLCKMDAETYNKSFGANCKEQYGQTIKTICWAQKVDAHGDIVAETMENLLEYVDGHFAYTCRHKVVDATLQEALTVMLNSMESF